MLPKIWKPAQSRCDLIFQMKKITSEIFFLAGVGWRVLERCHIWFLSFLSPFSSEKNIVCSPDILTGEEKQGSAHGGSCIGVKGWAHSPTFTCWSQDSPHLGMWDEAFKEVSKVTRGHGRPFPMMTGTVFVPAYTDQTGESPDQAKTHHG